MDYLSLLQPLVAEIDVDSAYGPPIHIVNPFAPAAPSGGGLDPMAVLQPQLTIRFNDGSAPLVLAPWGNPPPSRWNFLVGLFAVGGVVLVGFAIKGGKQWKKERHK